MKVSRPLNQHSILEDRRRLVRQREMNEAYKKNASYTQASKHRMLEVLENLISDKKEKDLHENTQLSSKVGEFAKDKETSHFERKKLTISISQRLNKAIIQYLYQMQLSKNNFQINEPRYSLVV